MCTQQLCVLYQMNHSLASKKLLYQGRIYDFNATCSFANALFWALGDNLGLKHPVNSCNRVAFAAKVQKKKLKCCRALKVAKVS